MDFQTDTFDSIEVVFHVHPTYRKVTEVLFCAAEPAKKDHIQVQQKLAPFQKLDFSQHLKEGRHRLRVTNPTMNFYFDVQEGCPSTEICWDLESESEKVICGRETIFKIQNSKNQVRNLSIEQLWWVDDILHPADIFSLTEYRDVFSKDSLESNVKISLGVQVIMFTDIVNSTNFYNQKGDAAAFNDVKKHFLEAFDIARRHDGAVIKTIGDSIMASFSDPDKALKAAVLIQETFHSSREDTSIRLRISLHLGQVIAVHLLQGIDLFGATINKAAKLQACANTGEIACSDEFFKTITRPSSENWEAFTEKRQSSLVFKETLLQAHVIQCHKMMDHKKQKSA